MKRSFYQNTARTTATAPVTAAQTGLPSYEQPFPGYEEDFMYFTRSYPFAVRQYVLPVRDAFDKLEYNGSFMFDRYPDYEQLLRIADDILKGNDTNRDILLMLILHELMRRRERYRHRQRT